MSLGVVSGNADALNLWNKMGFEGSESKLGTYGEKEHTLIVMTRSLRETDLNTSYIFVGFKFHG